MFPPHNFKNVFLLVWSEVTENCCCLFTKGESSRVTVMPNTIRRDFSVLRQLLLKNKHYFWRYIWISSLIGKIIFYFSYCDLCKLIFTQISITAKINNSTYFAAWAHFNSFCSKYFQEQVCSIWTYKRLWKMTCIHWILQEGFITFWPVFLKCFILFLNFILWKSHCTLKSLLIYFLVS